MPDPAPNTIARPGRRLSVQRIAPPATAVPPTVDEVVAPHPAELVETVRHGPVRGATALVAGGGHPAAVGAARHAQIPDHAEVRA